MGQNGCKTSRRIVCTAALAASILVLSGCGIFRSAADPVGSVYAPPSRDAQAKAFTPPPGKAAIYLYETRLFANWLAGMRDPCMVSLDTKYYGDFQWNGYFCWVIEPGEHVIHVEGFIDPAYLFPGLRKPIIDNPFIPASITVISREGEAIIIEHDSRMHGFMQMKSTLEVMDFKEGRAAIERRRLTPHPPAED